MKAPGDNNPPKVAIYTLGCKVNQFETACLKEKFQSQGCIVVPFQDQADFYIINSCAVTAEAQRQSAQMVRKAIRNHPESRVIATGCAGQLFPESFSDIPGVYGVIDQINKLNIPDMLKESVNYISSPASTPPLTFPALENLFPFPGEKTRAFLRIQDGCNAHCSYCIVPKARGRSRSLAIESVLSGVDLLWRQDVKEMILTGIHLGQYGEDLSPKADLVNLLTILLTSFPRMYFRLSSMEPREIPISLVQLFKEYPNLCPHLHIPLQSGSNEILHRMNRTYSKEYYRRLIQTLRQEMPLAAIGADLIVGFPGEGENQFKETLEFISETPLSYLHLFPFSPRPGTPASEFPDQVPRRIIKERLQILRALDRQKREAFITRCRNQDVSALTLGLSKRKGWTTALTENYLTVSIPGGLKKNDRVRIRLKETGLDGLEGEILLRSSPKE